LADRVREFLRGVEEGRGYSGATRNQRLAAIRSLAQFIAMRGPEHIDWGSEVLSIPFKKVPRALIPYLEKLEMEALLAAPDRSTAQERRDRAVLLFLYNTGARADEAVYVRIVDLQLGLKPESDPSSVLIRGKGNKQRRGPLWARTVTRVGGAGGRAHRAGARLPQPPRAAVDAVWRLRPGRAVRGEGGGGNAIGECEACEPAHDPAHGGDAPVARGWTSTRSGRGWVTSRLTRRTCTRRSIWR
jgi:integrase